MSLNKALYSSKSCEWSTPDDIFAQLNAEYGPFTLDPCATSENARAPEFYTKEDNGLLKEWSGRVFMNPPYGREIYQWMEKAWNSWTKCNIIVCLVPSRTDTAWWHDFVEGCANSSVTFIRGRLKFGGGKSNAPFPSAIVVYR